MTLLDEIVRIAIEAGEVVMDVYAREFEVELKPDRSPVTLADVEAERIILAQLAGIAPNIPVVAEESVARGVVPPPSSEFFLVDPLDGSREFIARNGEFTVNIALIRDGVPLMGVVHAPALRQVWWGENEAFSAPVAGGVLGEVASIRCAGIEGPGCRVVASRSHGSAELDAWLETVAVTELISAGSSLKFCRLAEGAADLYPRFGRTMEWDTAAGDAVLRAAGGSVLTVSETPLTYGKRGRADADDFANPDFIAWTPRGWNRVRGAGV